MKRAGIVLHGTRAAAAEVGRMLAEQLVARGVSVVAVPDDGERLGQAVDIVAAERLGERTDLVFVLGGDGTMLRAASLVAASGTPLLGVNLGRLGFLTHIERDELDDVLERLVRDEYEVEERMTLEGEVIMHGEIAERIWAFNDVIIEKLSPGRLIKLSVAIDEVPFTSLAADGLIVSSPTGSTAYSFSAHGPVVSPQLDCLIATPVSAHMLFDRSIVISPRETFTITVLPDCDAVSLSLDGRKGVELATGAVIHVRAGASRVRMARVTATPFWTIVRTKFGLRGNIGRVFEDD